MFAVDVEHAVAADVLVHDLLEPLQTLKWIDVAWRHRARDDFVSTDAIVLHRLVHRFLELLDVIVVDLWRFGLVVDDVSDGRLRGEASFGERAGRELVRRAADRVARAKQSLDRRRAVVAPLVLRLPAVLEI